MAQAGQLQFGVDETYLSNSVSRALIKGVNEAKRSGGALTPNINEQAWRMPLGRITGDVDKFKSSLNAANQRVIAFSASASVFYGISTALKGLVTSTISVNKNMTDLNAIFKLSAADLTKFKNELFDVARSTGQAIDTVSKSSIEFSRQGLGVQETLKRTRDALILTRLTGLDAAEAANTLTAAVNSFNKSGLGTTEILNKMVAADSAFAVSSKDIADALVRVGSSAQDAGVQFNELIALVTTTKQVTGRDGAVIGNALKTLLARQDRGTVIETLEKLGVTVRDASSNVLPYISVLKNLAKQYDTLGISQKQQVSQLLGGVYQSNILKALMGDLAKSNSVYEQSLNAVGKAQDEAIKRNEYLNSSLATTIENLKTSFTQISSNLGENVLNKNIKSIGSGINTIFGKEFSDSFMNGLKGVDSEGAGNFIGQGLIKGISNVFGVSGGIPGAGLLAIGATLFKVLSSTLGTALKDMQNLLAFNEKSLAIQQGIDKAILGANSAEQTRLLTAKTLADQEQVILDILLRQKAAMQTMAAEKNALRVDVISNNPKLMREAKWAAKSIPGAAGGLLPSIAAESHAISRGVGGASSSARPVIVPNFNFGGGKTGPIVANTDEYLVKNYAGGGSAIFNKQMIGRMGLPNGAVKIAASGWTPLNIENQYGSIGGILRDKQFEINGITTAQKGMGYSNKLYAELVSLLGEKGAQSIKGMLVPQASFNQDLKAILPQLIRGRYGKNNTLRFFNEYEEFGPTLGLKGGAGFDSDLSGQSSRIKYLLNSGFGSLPEFTTYLAGGHIPNFARRGRPSIKGRQIRYEGPMDFSSILGPEGLLELFTIFGFGLGDHPSKSTIDAKTLQKFGINIPSGLTPGSKFPYRNYAAGGIPNSVAKAIDRELKAGAPLSSIYVDSDPRLISPKNPRGILVANRRDEPAGGFEGVNKYRELGLDPKAAGATHIPNFADPSELILNYIMKKYPNAGEAAKVISPQTYPSLGNAEKEISKKLSEIIKNVNLKDIDFLSGSQNISKTLQTKIKDAVGKSFAGVDFGKTSAFSKLSDEVLLGRKKEINGLIQLQTAQKKAEISAQRRLEYEKRVGLSNIGERIINTSSRVLSPETLAAAQAKSQANYAAFAGSTMATKTPQELYLSELKMAMKESNTALKRMVAANEIDRKLSSGIKYGQLTGLEQIALQKQFQKQAFQNLGFGATGLSLEQTLRNKDARQQIAQYVNTQIAQISENPRFAPQPSRLAKWGSRISGAALPLAFGAPMLAGFIPEGQGGTWGGRASGVTSGALQGLGTGAAIGMSFGPYGAAIGAAAGTMVGAISGVASKWNKSFDEIAREIDDANSKNRQVVSNIQLYIQQADQITELINSGTDPRRIKEIIKKQADLYASFNDKNIRSAILGGKPEEAIRLANERAMKTQLGGNIVSSAARGNEEASFLKFFRKDSAWSQILGSASTFGLYGSVNEISKQFGGKNIAERIGIGGVSEANKKDFINALLESSDFNKSDIDKFSKLVDVDVIKALTDFKDKLNLTFTNIETLSKTRSKNDLRTEIQSFITQKGQRISDSDIASGAIFERTRGFQLLQSDWKKAALQNAIATTNLQIRGSSAIRQSGMINSSLLENDINLTDTTRIARAGAIEEDILQKNNALAIAVQARQIQNTIAGLSSEEKNKTDPKQLMSLVNMFGRIGKGGDLSELQNELEKLNNTFDNGLTNLTQETKDANSDGLSAGRQQIELLSEAIIKFNELKEQQKAQLAELKLSNGLNIIRSREQGRQNFVNNANFSVDTFTQVRRNSEAARGLTFTNTRYKEGLTLQAMVNEQDYLSGLGIAHSDESLAEYNDIKRARAKNTLAELLSQETGQKVSPYDTESLTNAAMKSRNSSRYLETIKLSNYDANAEIRKLAKESGSSADILDKVMKMQSTDPVQNLIAQNTSSLTDSSRSINSNMVSGFDYIRSLLDSAFNKNKSAEEKVMAYRGKIDASSNLELLKIEKQKLIEEKAPPEQIREIDAKLSEAAVNLKKASESLDRIIIKKDSVAPIKITEPQKTTTEKTEGEIQVLDPFVVSAKKSESETDRLSNSIGGFKQGLIDANTQWGTFADLAEKSGQIVSNSLGSAFGDFVTGAMKGKDAFRAFASSVLSDIAKMYAQKAISGLIASIIPANMGGAITANTGGSILKFASGGNVPALLTGGEFYYTPSQARSIGQNNLHAINSGTAKFARGGLVSGGSGYMDDVPAMLDNGGFVIKRSAVQKYGASKLSDIGGGVAMFASGGNVAPVSTSGGGSGNGNTSVKIDIHDNRTSASADSDQSTNDPEFNKRLSLAVKTKVLQVIQEQRRIGGVLRQGKNY